MSEVRPAPSADLLVVMTWTDEPVGRVAKRFEEKKVGVFTDSQGLPRLL